MELLSYGCWEAASCISYTLTWIRRYVGILGSWQVYSEYEFMFTFSQPNRSSHCEFLKDSVILLYLSWLWWIYSTINSMILKTHTREPLQIKLNSSHYLYLGTLRALEKINNICKHPTKHQSQITRRKIYARLRQTETWVWSQMELQQQPLDSFCTVLPFNSQNSNSAVKSINKSEYWLFKETRVA